jgi:beta-N-acetylhexosaminidase
VKPLIFGLAGTAIGLEERALFRAADPAGYILFKRNVADRTQLRALTDELRTLSGRDQLPILIDQEGGRVARLTAPEWPEFPSGGEFDALYDRAPMTAIQAARLNAEALGHTLAEVGVTVNCLPVLDTRYPETHAAIGDRALGSHPHRIAALAQAILDGMLKAGVLGVVKHMPGQGRATVDSHYDLPRVCADAEALERDILPFMLLKDAPIGMTGHVVFEAWDAEYPATLSRTVIRDIIRTRIGFGGLLLSDDIEMKALTGTSVTRALACLEAGCDIALHCSAVFSEMASLSEHCPDLGKESRARLDSAMATTSFSFDAARLKACLADRDSLMAACG